MGMYINPPDMSKERFLELHGTQVAFPDWEGKPEHHLPVVLVDNGVFTAAGICDSKQELEAFTRPDDNRPKKYYYVHIADLKEYF